MKKILLIGSGGREHALAWKIAQSPNLEKLYVAPGNGGTATMAVNVPISIMDFEALARFAQDKKIDLTVVSMDDPLAAGIVDFFQDKGLRIFGPNKAAAQLEASKAFAKQIMQDANIPTAHFHTFTDYAKAVEYVQTTGAPIVVKASGLALGKGVYVCSTLDEALAALDALMVTKIFGDAGSEVVIEEFLQGPEVSIHAFCDGKTATLFPTSQDHKRIKDNDTGPNTGGMGTIAPVPGISDELIAEVRLKIINPALTSVSQKGHPYVGCLYPGLMLTKDGPKVLEFNARFGDPETQSYMRLLKTDIIDIFESCVDGTLDTINIEWNAGFATCIVLASGGYPGNYEKGLPISGIEAAEKLPGIAVFHAGTKLENNQIFTSGGRVLGVTAVGDTLEFALEKAYQAVNLIHFEGMQYRKDIGRKALFST